MGRCIDHNKFFHHDSSFSHYGQLDGSQGVVRIVIEPYHRYLFFYDVLLRHSQRVEHGQEYKVDRASYIYYIWHMSHGLTLKNMTKGSSWRRVTSSSSLNVIGVVASFLHRLYTPIPISLRAFLEFFFGHY